MTERGLPIVDGAPACPFVAFDDARDDRADRPDPRHRCYAESPPAPRARAHQEVYCLAANFPVCPTFQDWARREAARVSASAAGGSPAERLRDVPAQREAGARPPAFGPSNTAGATAAGGAGPPGAAGVGPAGTGFAGLPGSGLPGPAAIGPDRTGAASRGEQAHDPDAPSHREPWDLPPRRSVKPEWSAPPPWGASRGAGLPNDDVDAADAPGFLRPQAPFGVAPDSGDHGLWAGPAGRGDDGRAGVDPNADDEAGGDGGSAGEGDRDGDRDRNAAMARLRALGIGDAPADPDAAPALPRPVPGVTRSVDPATGRAIGAGRPTPAAPIPDGAVDASGPGAEPRRASSGLAKAVGWDRRPKAGASRAPRKAEKEPAWERPRRFEAYPTLKTRVGMPVPPKLLLALGALVVAALILFFVPPLFLKESGAGGPGATRSPGTSAGASAPNASGGASSAPTTKPAATPQTYKIKQGDTLSRIAKQFGVTVDAILAANKNIKNPNKIAPGDIIVIPSPGSSYVLDAGASSSP